MTIDSLSTATAARPIERHPGGHDAALVPGSAARAPATAVETAAAVQKAAAVPTLDQVSKAVSQLNQSPQARAQGLEFSIDKDSKRTVVKVIDQTTKEVLRQIPSPEALEIAKSLGNAGHNAALLIKQTA
jgi:flagellar protein FlaG